MNKIRVKVPDGRAKTFSDLENVLAKSDRKYDHISLNGLRTEFELCAKFLQKHNEWKSLKLSTCQFSSALKEVACLAALGENLLEIEFDNVVVDSNLFSRRDQSSPSLVLPKLEKLKTSSLPFDFICTTLKILEMNISNQPRALSLLKSNPNIEELTLTYEGIDSIFQGNFAELGINLKLKKLHIKRRHSSDPVSSSSIQKFEAFLMSQSECVEEMSIEWFVGRPPQSRQETDWFPIRRARRMGGADMIRIEAEDHLDRRMARGIRFVFQASYCSDDDPCIRSLNLIFREFKLLKKLVITDKQGFLSDSFCPSVNALNIVPNQKITELRLRITKAPQSNVLFGKLAEACPNLKNLVVHDMDQALLEICANRLPNIEVIFALSFRVDKLPKEDVKLPNLERINFCECVIKDQPDEHFSELKLSEQKSQVLQWLK